MCPMCIFLFTQDSSHDSDMGFNFSTMQNSEFSDRPHDMTNIHSSIGSVPLRGGRLLECGGPWKGAAN